MAGRGDEEAGGAARAEAWLMRMHDLLKTAAEEAVRRLTPLPADADDAAVDRRARLIVNAARAVKATADLAARPAQRAARPEDDMTEKDIDDIDPGDLARVQAADGDWEIVQFRHAEMTGAGQWRLSGLLRGRQGTEGQARAGAEAGATVVMLDEALERPAMRTGERGLPLIWRVGPRGAPPGGDGFAEAAFTWRGVHGRPWAPARLTIRRTAQGRVLSWIARARLDSDRWDGEVQASDPMRFRIRALDEARAARTWTVEAQQTLYDPDLMAEDFPDGPGPGARIAVSHWSPVFGWGVEATAALT